MFWVNAPAQLAVRAAMAYYGEMSTTGTIIFDLDGTLIHSAPDIHAAINVALVEMRRSPLTLLTIISFIGDGIEALVERSLNATGGMDQALHQRTVAVVLDYYLAHTTTLTQIYPGVVETLDALKAAGARMGVCTNKPTGPARDICEQLDLARFFEVIIGAEDGQPKKPDPSSLVTTIASLNGRLDTSLYVGDSGVDYHTARNAGVPFRLFSGGYLNDLLPDLAEDDKFGEWAPAAILAT